MVFPGKLGEDEGPDRGPPTGQGGSISGGVSAGEDVDDASEGLPPPGNPQQENLPRDVNAPYRRNQPDQHGK